MFIPSVGVRLSSPYPVLVPGIPEGMGRFDKTCVGCLFGSKCLSFHLEHQEMLCFLSGSISSLCFSL